MTEKEPAKRGRGGPFLGGLVGALALAVAIFLIMLADAHSELGKQQNIETAREAAGGAAIQTFNDLTTADYANEAAYVSKLRADTGGNLHDQIQAASDSLFSSTFTPKKQKLTGKAGAAGVSVVASSQSATALVSGTVTTVTSDDPKGTSALQAYSMTLSLVAGHWLVTDASTVSGGGS